MYKPALFVILTLITILHGSFGLNMNHLMEDDKKYTGETTEKLEEDELDKQEYLKMEAKIAGGNTSRIEDFSHAALLEVKCGGDDYAWTCGSSILNQNIIITAAHCVVECELYRPKIKVFAGCENYTQSPVEREVDRYIIHKAYNPERIYADIALGYTKESFPLGPTISRGIISQSFPKNAVGFNAGWGLINNNSEKEPTTQLYSVFQIVYNIDYCKGITKMFMGQYCADSGSPSSYPSMGDSGNAHINDQKQILGLVSHRSYNQEDKVIYTNVSFFYGWITTQANYLYCKEDDDSSREEKK